FTGGIEAYDSSVSVTSQNAVFDRVGTFVNSSLSLEKGAKLTAQSGIFSTGTVDVKENASPWNGVINEQAGQRKRGSGK
ncbi:hypothetical protein N6N95_24835, partial [Escherichia coli]